MCGIAGFLHVSGFHPPEARGTVAKLADALFHRGPDDSGEWVDGDAGIAMAHRRLSILDLSPAGHQPMVSASGRYVLVFNGEIYNHLDIREEIEASGGVGWRGHSDTETLLAGFERFGIELTLKKTVGMFAMGLWDRQDKKLTLARDRIGEKPLYFGWQDDTFLFGSELKALRKHPAFQSKINRSVLALYLRSGYIPAPHSIYNGIYKILPGTYLQIQAQTSPGVLPAPVPYWSLYSAAMAGMENPFQGDDEDAVDELESRLKQAVSLQRVADVPLGAFLSGGIDSSTIVALMQALSSQPVKTFTIGFHEQEYNEAAHADAVARHLGTDHTALYVSSSDVMEHIPKIYALYDEPFSDASPSMIISRLARQKVKVSLSGDGGDELFGGYERYFVLNAVWKNFSRIPLAMKSPLAGIIQSVPAPVLSGFLSPLVSLRGRPPSIPFGMRLHQYARVLRCEDGKEAYRIMMSHGDFESALIQNGGEITETRFPAMNKPEFKSFQESMMYEDAMSYLPDDILVKVDRSAMSVSLETRAPLLDHRIVEFSWKLPLGMKIRDGKGKWILRQVLGRYVKKELVERPKMGFNLPGAEWLRGPLREWTEEMLSETRLTREGYFKAGAVQNMLKQHNAGQYNWQALLWRLLAFQSWLGSA